MEMSSLDRKFMSMLHFPPGFRFHPSDEELIVHYLINKLKSRPLPACVIAEIELYNYNPWELPKKALFGEEEWYFFSPRDRKYPNGVRPNRTAASGFWKATGTDKPILTSSGSRRIGVKKNLVFYAGRPPKGEKTDWIMNEYRLPDTGIRPVRSNGSMRLDDWVLCHVRQKGNMSKNAWEAQAGPGKLTGYLPKIDELPSVYKAGNADIFTDSLFKDYHILGSMLAGQGLPPLEAVTSASFPSKNNCGSVNEDGPVKGSIHVTSSLSVGFFNPSKGNPNQENRYNNVVPTIKAVTKENQNDDLLLGNVMATNAPGFFSQNLSQGEIYNPNTPDAIMDLRELNECAFSEDFYNN